MGARVIHILHAGLPLCGFDFKFPRDWPKGHVWVGLEASITVHKEFGEDFCERCWKNQAKLARNL